MPKARDFRLDRHPLSTPDQATSHDSPAPESEPSLAAIGYTVAYEILPRYVFREREKLVTMFRDSPAWTGPFLYLTSCQSIPCKPYPENGLQFQARHGQMDDAREYYLLKYPEPAALDLTGVDMERLPPGAMPVLAPYFSAMIVDRTSGDAQYFVLGQAPLGGTTLRSVTANGRNTNLGSGPEPGVEAFLEAIRVRN